MIVALGPVPAELRQRIREWVSADRWATPGIGPDAVMLSGGPAWCTLLTADGEVYWWSPWDDSLTLVEDGPPKVQEIAIGAKYRQELRCWLPVQPTDGAVCPACRGVGWREYGLITVRNLVEVRPTGQPPREPPREVSFTAPGQQFVCQDCAGLGWVPIAEAEPSSTTDPGHGFGSGIG